jgi:hypothetical protein
MTDTTRNSQGPGLLTWCEIWCDVENSKSFRSSRDGRVSPGHRLKGASALHNSLASIFTAPGVMTWSDMSGNARKDQVTRLVTLRHRSTMSGALGSVAGNPLRRRSHPLSRISSRITRGRLQATYSTRVLISAPIGQRPRTTQDQRQ